LTDPVATEKFKQEQIKYVGEAVFELYFNTERLLPRKYKEKAIERYSLLESR
jgi:hypothetical protein